jgi:hypothetical protein
MRKFNTEEAGAERMLRVNVLGTAAVLSLASPGSGIADDPAPLPRPTSPAKMSCADFATKLGRKSPAGLTRVSFSIGGLKFGDKVTFDIDKSGSQYCARIDAGAWAITRDVTSFYFVWAVTDKDRRCEAEAQRTNQTIKAFEQEHINDAALIAEAQTAKLRDRLKARICAPEVQKVEEAVGKIVEGAMGDTIKEWDNTVHKRDGGGSHTHRINCACAR